MFYGQDENTGKPSGLLCPITGSPLIYNGYEYGTMDGDFYYHAESDPKIKYEKNMRSLYYELVNSEKEWDLTGSERVLSRRYFKFEDGAWTEYFAVKSHGFPKLFPIGTSTEEVKAWQDEDERKYQERQAEYSRKVAEGEITPWPVPKVQAGTIANELVSVQPLPPPSDQLFYLDVKYHDRINDIKYPFLVTLENIERVKKDFKKEDVIIGDQVEYWETGGVLSMRAGEQIIRAGEIVHKRLTKMS